MATRTVTRKRTPEILHAIQLYLFSRSEETAAKKAKDTQASSIRSFVRDHGTVETDEDGNEVTGNIRYLLPEPIAVGARTYAGMELRKSTSITFDDEAAIALAVAKGWDLELIGRWDFTVDQDMVYLLNQRGKLTDDEIDGLLTEGEPKYALWPIEEP